MKKGVDNSRNSAAYPPFADAESGVSSRKRLLREFRPVLVLATSEASARLASFVFYLIAARVLEPDGFGVVRYTITLSFLAFAVLQVLAMSMNRELGAARQNRERTRAILGTGLVVAAALLVVSSALCIAAAAAGLTGGANTLGLVAVLAGTALFQIYYEIGRGMGAVKRMTITYLGASLSQLLIFVGIVAAMRPTPLVALLVFGGSGVIPVAISELVYPVVRGQHVLVEGRTLRRLALVSAPLFVAHLAYVGWTSADQIWVANVLGTYQIGIYGAARNLSGIFLIFPSAAYGVIMPRIAELRETSQDSHARRLVYAATLTAAGTTSILALFVIFLRVPLLRMLYGSSYTGAATSLAFLAVAAVLYAAFVMLTTSSVGWGRPGVYTSGLVVAVLVEIVCLSFFSGSLGGPKAYTASLAYLISIATALLVVLAQLHFRPLVRSSTLEEGTNA